MALGKDGDETVAQLRASAAELVVTLGQPAAHLLTDPVGTDRVVLRRHATYGERRSLLVGSRSVTWLPRKNLGHRPAVWEQYHHA